MKTFCKYLLLLTLALSYSNVYSQTDSTVTIIELEDKDNIIIDGDIIEPKRDVELYSILPVLTFDSGRDEISIISTAVTFENVEYEICNEVGTTYISGMLYLIKGEEEFISTELLPSGTYTICINIDNCSYYGTFTK